MLIHPQFDPVALQIGPLAVRWYGLTYLAAFLFFMVLGQYRARKQSGLGWQPADVDDMLLYGILGVVLGGRLGYCLFYKPGYYLANPLDVFAVWQGGMSFHGGLLGVIFAMWFYARRSQRAFWKVMDFVSPLVPLGLASGRMGNFINAELPGRAADPSLPWAMIFPAVDPIPRHPSQLYQFAGEGLLLFALVWVFSNKQRPEGRVAGAFAMGYATLRFAAEFFREPDAYLGFLSLGMTMGQWLCVPLMGIGVWLSFRPAKNGIP